MVRWKKFKSEYLYTKKKALSQEGGSAHYLHPPPRSAPEQVVITIPHFYNEIINYYDISTPEKLGGGKLRQQSHSVANPTKADHAHKHKKQMTSCKIKNPRPVRHKTYHRDASIVFLLYTPETRQRLAWCYWCITWRYVYVLLGFFSWVRVFTFYSVAVGVIGSRRPAQVCREPLTLNETDLFVWAPAHACRELIT